jgi:hypothetical protein
MNSNLDEAFQYHDNDINELAEAPSIKKKLGNISDFVSPRFLMGLKKKQRMQEYWKSRVKKDFTKLNKDAENDSNTGANDYKVQSAINANNSISLMSLIGKLPSKSPNKISTDKPSQL